MSSLAWVVGAWSMLVSIVAPWPPPVAPLEGAQTPVGPIIVVDTSEGDNTASAAPQSHTRGGQGFSGVISAYSCDAHPANGMHPCGLFRDGSTPHAGLHGLVAAGPYEWLGRTVYVEGFGSVTLVDTPRNAWYGDKVHIDIFMSYDAAVRHGIQERRVYLK